MTDKRDKLAGLTASTPVKPRLVVLKAEPTPDATEQDAAKLERPKSNLGKLMTAWADAIDRDVKLLLDL